MQETRSSRFQFSASLTPQGDGHGVGQGEACLAEGMPIGREILDLPP